VVELGIVKVEMHAASVGKAAASQRLPI
jgi:hypothetical protein